MKTYKVVVQNIAKDDVKGAIKWYENQQKYLSKRFVVDMKSTLQDIANNPTSFAIRKDNLRLANFKVFPYAVHFFINAEVNTVLVIAILHSKRHPDISSNP